MKTKEIQEKKSNARLYPIYKMFSWDLLFYYSIIFLFLTQAKHFSASQVLLGDAFFTGTCLVMQIPAGFLVDKIGKRNSLVFANICMCIFSFLLIITKTYELLLVAFFVDAIGYVIKSVCENNMLYDSLPNGKKRGSLYSTIDGVGASRYYIIDAITSLMAGYLFVINPYIPMFLCFFTNLISTILATRFNKIDFPEKDFKNRESMSEYFEKLRIAIRFSFKSKRMLCLLIFFGIISGLTYNLTTFRSGVLEQVQLPEQYFGIVFAIIQIMASICSGTQNIIHKRFRNKTLSFMGIPYVVSCMIIGFLAMGNPNYTKIFCIILLFVIQGAIKGAYNVLIYRYLNNFTNKEIRGKLATIRNIFYNIISILISLLGALLLHVTDSANTILIIGGFLTIAIILLLDYMRGRVGLKPEKYSKIDLKYNN